MKKEEKRNDNGVESDEQRKISSERDEIERGISSGKK